ncbi:MAG: hypothetical protein WC708_13995 [Lentisphaeria bacterium]
MPLDPPEMNSPAIDGPRACTPAERPEVVALVDQAMRQGIWMLDHS